MTRILIVEDEPLIAEFLEKGLRFQGFTSNIANNAQQALALTQNKAFDLVILDLGFPGEHGLTVLRELRHRGETLPIIILTARDHLQDKLTGLEGGANDYMTKPFQFQELVVRIRLQLRGFHHAASRSPVQEILLTTGDFVLDLRKRVVLVGDRSIDLAAREYALAEIFFRRAGEVLSREELLKKVWGYTYDPGSNIVDVYVGYLRKKLGTGAIETIRGLGYRLKVKQIIE